MPVRLVVEEGPYSEISRADLARRARAMLVAVGRRRDELSVVLTNDERIRSLNRTYRKKDRPTDVLAFPQLEGVAGEEGLPEAPEHEDGTDRGPAILGDVVISVPTATRQASEHGRDVTAEVTMLLAHGILHLLGWDHDTAAKDRLMRAETDRLCHAAAPKTAALRPARAPKTSVATPVTRATAGSPKRSRGNALPVKHGAKR